ncbi:hypothetical protein [Microbacterium gilvum]|uniref:Uncharacterized protein n=1 Tax=Microbacterium gilvum TaxID=1336204 RepID=A0ABP8ZR78_9MICO
MRGRWDRWKPAGLVAFWQSYRALRYYLRSSRRDAARTAWLYGPVKPTPTTKRTNGPR